MRCLQFFHFSLSILTRLFQFRIVQTTTHHSLINNIIHIITTKYSSFHWKDVQICCCGCMRIRTVLLWHV
jgi:hypothetical protein